MHYRYRTCVCLLPHPNVFSTYRIRWAICLGESTLVIVIPTGTFEEEAGAADAGSTDMNYGALLTSLTDLD